MEGALGRLFWGKERPVNQFRQQRRTNAKALQARDYAVFTHEHASEVILSGILESKGE